MADPRWTPGVLDSLAELPLRYHAVKVLALLEPHESWVEPLCAALPDPAEPGGFWSRELVEQLGRTGDERALPWLLAALDRSAMIWEAAKVALVPTVTLPSPTNKHLTKVLRGKKRDRYEDEVYEAVDAMDPLPPQLLGFRRRSYDAEEPGTSELLLQLPAEPRWSSGTWTCSASTSNVRGSNRPTSRGFAHASATADEGPPPHRRLGAAVKLPVSFFTCAS